MQPPRLHLITDPDLGDALGGQVREALSGVGHHGPTVAVHLRAKHWPTAHLLVVGRQLRAHTRAAGAKLLVNDRIDVAKLVDADGVHLPELGASPSEARAILGEPCLVGTSCHDRSSLDRAVQLGADFATLSPVFGVPHKGPALGIDGFARLVRDTPLPTIALGGVGPEQAQDLVALGASGVACIRAVMGAQAPREVVKALLTAVTHGD